MITGLVVLLWLLKVLLVLAVLAVLAIGADYAYYEFQQSRKTSSPKAEKKAPVSSTPNIDALIHNAKAQRRFHRQSEEEAWDGFFETTYIRGFENNGTLRNYGAKMPSRKAYQFFNLMDELSAKVAQSQKDASIFEQTEDL